MKKFKMNYKTLVSLILAISIGGSFSVNQLKDKSNETPVNDYGISYDIDDNNYDFTKDFKDDFYNGFKANSSLVKEYSDIYPSIEKFIEDYYVYLDCDKILKNISELEVKYVSKIKNFDTLLGYYDNNENVIYFADRLNSKSSDAQKEIKEHEFFHMIFGDGFGASKWNFSHTGLALDEGVATLLTQESGDFANAVYYTKNANYIRVICELVGTDKFMEAYGQNNLDKLIDELSLYSSKSDSKKLIKLIDDGCIDYGFNPTEADISAWNIIEKMYLNKNGISVEESNDVVMKYYANKLGNKGYRIDNAEAYSHARIEKNYFINIGDARLSLVKNGEEYGSYILDSNNSVKGSNTK